MHLTFDLYLLTLCDQLPVASLAHRAHTHLVEVCEICAAEWEGGERRVGAPAPFANLTQAPPAEKTGPSAWYVTLPAIERHKERLAHRREAARLAREDLNRLLRLPLDRWRARVAGARTRFRSRAFAQLLLSEYRQRVRTEPRQAAALVDLVPLALAWTENRPELTWALALCTRAAALRANALRIAGDLPAAATAFATLRSDRSHRKADLGPGLCAEIDSLEASLCIDQRRFSLAEQLLASSIATYHQTGDEHGESRALIKLANLYQHLKRPADVLLHFERAAGLLDPQSQPYLMACTVTGRVNTLCDLDRHAEADQLLRSRAKTYMACGDRYAITLYELLQGRVALGLGRLAEAEQRFSASRDDFLEMGRDYDAILTSLYLADALLAAGEMSELRDLAADLVPLFRSRGVARETLASLRLLAQAVTAETVSAAVLEEVRRRLETSEHPQQKRPVATAQ